MQDIRPSVSSADQFAPPPRQASLTALASGLTIEDNAAVPPRAPVQVPVLAANGQYMPPSRNDSLMSVDQVNAKVAIAARHAMGIEDANRGTLTKEDAAGGSLKHPESLFPSINSAQIYLSSTRLNHLLPRFQYCGLLLPRHRTRCRKSPRPTSSRPF
jgi:hypothetical protein